MNESQNLGPAGIWQIKNFPDVLREAITQAAKEQRVTVGELMTRIMVAVIEADWRVGDVVNPSATRSPAAGDDLARVERAVASAVALAGAEGVPAGFRRRANRLLRDSLPAAHQARSSAPPLKAIAADPPLKAIAADPPAVDEADAA